MNENLLNILSIYCNDEIKDLKNSELYVKLQKIVNELKYNLVCEYGKANDNKKSDNIYISVTILNDKNEFIEIYDEGFLTICTVLVLVDKKHRYRFFSWKDEEFIEDLSWLIKELENIRNRTM